MKVLLAISGGIAAYKCPELVRQLRKGGHEVQCALSKAATRLVSVHALAAVSSNPVHESLWASDGSMPHIDLPRWCDVFLLAPATADCMAKCALGLADDLITTAFLALEPEKKLLVAPAMNNVMWNKSIVQTHVQTLSQSGAQIIDPVSGELACGEEGIGAMADPSHIAELVSGL